MQTDQQRWFIVYLYHRWSWMDNLIPLYDEYVIIYPYFKLIIESATRCW